LVHGEGGVERGHLEVRSVAVDDVEISLSLLRRRLYLAAIVADDETGAVKANIEALVLWRIVDQLTANGKGLKHLNGGGVGGEGKVQLGRLADEKSDEHTSELQ